MKTQTLLRVGIYLLGIFAIMTSVTNGAYYVLTFASAYDFDVGFFLQTTTPKILCYFIFPLAFAFWAFGFAERSARLLLGHRAEEPVPGLLLSDRTLFTVAVQILGLYLVVEHGASCLSYLLEGFIHRARGTHQPDPRVVAEAAYSLAGLAGGLVLVLRANIIERKIRASSQALQTTPIPPGEN